MKMRNLLRFACLLGLLALPVAYGQEIDPDPDRDKREGARPPGEGMFTPIFPTLPGSKGTTRLRPKEVQTSASWQAWWQLNRGAYIDLRGRFHARGEAVAILGAAERRQPTHFELARDVSPKLEEIAKKNKELRSAALLAWVRSATAEDAERAVETVLADLPKAKAEERERLILYLGISREALAFDALWDVIHDSADGRKLLGRGGPIPIRTRALAALAFGALGDVDAVEDLLSVLQAVDDKRSAADLTTACVVSLGILAAQSKPEERASVLSALRDGVADSRWPIEARAAVPVALVRVGGQREVAFVSSLLPSARMPREVKQSCALALGLGAEHLSAQTFETLSRCAERESDAPLRAFAIVAVGEIAARGGLDPALDEAAQSRLLESVERFHLAALRGTKRSAADRAWYLLSAGLLARGVEAARDAVLPALLRSASKERSKDVRAAAVTALALSGDPSAGLALHGLLEKSKAPDLRARIAEALGVLGVREAADELLALCQEDEPERVRYHAALGFGLLADPEALAQLHQALADSDSNPARAALARVAGELGDRASVEPLLALATNDGLNRELRLHLLWALGTMGRHIEPGWQHAFGRGLNFLSAPPSLQMLLELS